MTAPDSRAVLLATKVPRAQTLTILDWIPDQLANSHLNWRVRRKRTKAAEVMVWSAAKQFDLRPVTGRVKVTITFSFAQKRRRDTDNLYARCKGVIDGLVKGGWIEDDNSEVMELVVLEAVSLFKQKSTRITLEPIP